nr:hypothetical protein [Tanacetum cinerariifolium]
MFLFVKTLPSFPHQYLCCRDCGGPHETIQCQLMNDYESNPCYDFNYFGIDQIEPSQYLVNQRLNIQNELNDHELFINELIQQKLHENAQLFLAIEITLDLPTVEPEDSLRMGDEHLNTILKMKSNELIKSSVENLVPCLSESKDLFDSECDMPVCNNFTTFSNILFDADDDFSSSNNKSFSNEDILKEIYLNPLFDEEIISIKIDPHHFNAESDLIESLLNHDSLIISSSSKIDSLLDEFAGNLYPLFDEEIISIKIDLHHLNAESDLIQSLLNQDSSIISSSKIDSLLDEFSGELILLKSIPLRIDEADCAPEEEIRLIEKFLYDNSSRRPSKDINS